MSLLDPFGDRRVWRRARTLADLGALTAAWLEGAIASHPGYLGRPDPETDELVPALAAVNRAGLVTICSQPGTVDYDDPGEIWSQRAAVDALADERTAHRVRTKAERAGLIVIDHGPARRWRCDYTRATLVTTCAAAPVTDFGAHLSRRLLRRRVFAACHGKALSAIYSARQVTVIDPDWGRNDRLWPLLVDAARGSGRCG